MSMAGRLRRHRVPEIAVTTMFLLAVIIGVTRDAGASRAAQAFAYGPTPTAHVTVPVVVQGNDETFICNDCPKSTSMHVTVHSFNNDLGFHNTTASGDLSVTFNTTGLGLGNHSVSAEGGGATVSDTFIVIAPSTSPALARTGTQIGGLVVIALGLLVGGAFVFLATRRRPRHAT
jgi:hypothetical protein